MRTKRAMDSLILLACLAAAASAAAAAADKAPGASRDRPTPAPLPPGAEYIGRTLDPFYTRHVLADGLLISGSSEVSHYALAEAAHLVGRLLAERPDVLKALIRKKVRVGVMAYNEMTTDIPEHRKLSPWYDKRARGLGGNPVTCGEENLLAFRGDPYRGESILIHEFAHIIHGRGLAAIDPTFDKRLRELYGQAKKTGRFRGYGMTSFGEFWAEGVQSWFNCNRPGGLAVVAPGRKRPTSLDTRKQMRAHMPELSALLARSFGGNRWTYVPVTQRLDQPHLKGYDPAQAPVFKWPKKVLETFQRIEAEKARKRKAAAGKGNHR